MKVAIIETEKGTIELELFEEDAPNTVANFEKLIEESNLFDFQKNVLVKIANNYDIGSEARKALASELISAEETKLIKSTNKKAIIIEFLLFIYFLINGMSVLL